MRNLWTGIMIVVLTSRWFCTLNLLFMSEKRYQRTLVEQQEVFAGECARWGIPTDETGRSHG